MLLKFCSCTPSIPLLLFIRVSLLSPLSSVLPVLRVYLKILNDFFPYSIFISSSQIPKRLLPGKYAYRLLYWPQYSIYHMHIEPLFGYINKVFNDCRLHIWKFWVFCVYCKYISHREQTWLFIYHLWPVCFNCCKSSEFSVKNLCVLNVTVTIGWSVTNCMFYMLQTVRFIYNNLTDVPL